MSATGRAALLLAVTATDLQPVPLRQAAHALGVPAGAAARALPWPAGRRLLQVADGVLLAAALAVPVALGVLQA